ncbi:CHAT domain-containing protein [Streptomyces sp. WAC00263]|uniref:CHAT domain-containing protein n=1 Tax=Streptomyces sp. WAC00263 TaxID=1917422 RepID=UPI0015EED446|nr:CHAT domain-containing protein [Streptomyces sp. WAC00263]
MAWGNARDEIPDLQRELSDSGCTGADRVRVLDRLARQLLLRWQATESTADLYSAIGALLEAMMLAPPVLPWGPRPEPEALAGSVRRALLLNMALGLRSGAPESAGTTSAEVRRILCRIEEPEERRAACESLAGLLTAQFVTTGDVEDLRAVLDLHDEGLSGIGEWEPAAHFAQVWAGLDEELPNDPRMSHSCFVQALRILAYAARHTRGGHGAPLSGRPLPLPAVLVLVARAGLLWSQRPVDITADEVQEVVDIVEPCRDLALRAAPPGGDIAAYLLRARLAALYFMRFNRSPSREHADVAVDAYADLVARTDPPEALLLVSSGNARIGRYEAFGTEGDLDAAVDEFRSALSLAASSPIQRAMAGNALCAALFTRAAVNLSEDDWHTAAGLLPEPGAARPASPAPEAGWLSQFSERYAKSVDGYLYKRYAAAALALTADIDPGREADLRRLVRLYEAVAAWAARLNSEADLDTGAERALAGLGHLLHERFMADGVPEDHRRCLDCLRAAADRARQGGGRDTVAVLADALLGGYQRTGSFEELSEAITLLKEERERPRDPAGRARICSQVSGALAWRFGRTGDPADLDQSVMAMRESADLTPADDPYLPSRLTNLVSKVILRVEFLGTLTELDEAVDLGVRAVDATPEGDKGLGLALSNLAGAYRLRHRVRGDAADIDAAVNALRRAVEVTDTGDLLWSQYVFNLGSCLIHATAEGRGALDEGIEHHRLALDATDQRSPLHPARVATLARGLIARGRTAAGRAEDVEEALVLLRGELPRDPEERWEVGQLLCARILARGLLAVPGAHRDPEAGTEAIGLLERYVRASTAPLQERVDAAVDWSALTDSFGGAEQALAPWSTAIELLGQAAWRGLPRADREARLARWSGLASQAAECAIRAGRPGRAVEFLEQGRSILWSQTLQTRDEAAPLDARAPELAARLREVGAALEAAGAGEPAGQDMAGIDRLVALGRTWDGLVEEARGVLGGKDPFACPAYPDLAGLAGTDPVVIVNVAADRCDALVVRPGEPLVIPLPGLTAQNAVARTNDFLLALHTYGPSRTSGLAGHVSLQLAISETQTWLWDNVADPVLNRLGLTAAMKNPTTRLWWCPTGPLALLPLHAAQYETDTGSTGVLDRVVPSYTPTLRALRRRRGGPDTTAADRGRLLVVSMPNTPGQPDLHHVTEEADATVRRLAVRSLTRLDSEDATLANVRAALLDATSVHLACHGRQRPDDPARSGVVLHDGTLTVVDIAQLQLQNAELCFLSACSTATGSPQLPDESIHLAAALQRPASGTRSPPSGTSVTTSRPGPRTTSTAGSPTTAPRQTPRRQPYDSCATATRSNPPYGPV